MGDGHVESRYVDGWNLTDVKSSCDKDQFSEIIMVSVRVTSTPTLRSCQYMNKVAYKDNEATAGMCQIC